MPTEPNAGELLKTYLSVMRGPVRGPQPRLAVGTGRTGDPSLPGNAARLPGYMSDQIYIPSAFDYAPAYNRNHRMSIPRSIKTGDNGRELVGTYQPHDFTPADRFFTQARSAYPWQVYSFPPDFRQTLKYQVAQKYQIQTFTRLARPLDKNNYFLGYTIDPSISAQIGGSGNGVS